MFTWIVVILYLTTMGCLSSDIIEEICIPWGAIRDYTIPATLLITTYVMPLMTMLFCYTRIVYKITHKVTYDECSKQYNVPANSEFVQFHLFQTWQ